MMPEWFAVMSMIGTIAFAVSGATTGIRKRLDLFGVNILALATAMGGGVIRDLMIGRIPPAFFKQPVSVLAALISANGVFLFVFLYSRMRWRFRRSGYKRRYRALLFWSDTVGLAAFTMNGVMVGMEQEQSGLLLIVFLGAVTGVGGGVLRDILAGDIPAILREKIYACASVLGAICAGGLQNVPGLPVWAAVSIGFAMTVLIRWCACVFRWDLPKAF